MVFVVGNGGTFNNGSEKALVVGGAYATSYGTVFGHGVTNAETDHAVVAFTVARTRKLFCDNGESVAAVEVVGVDNCERFVDYVFTHKHGVVGTPRFGAFGGTGVSFGKFVGRLENDFNGYMALVFSEDFFTEVVLKVFTYYENDFTEAGAYGVVDGVVHDGFAVGAELVELFKTAVTATHASGENKKSRFHLLIKYWLLDKYAGE